MRKRGEDGLPARAEIYTCEAQVWPRSVGVFVFLFTPFPPLSSGICFDGICLSHTSCFYFSLPVLGESRPTYAGQDWAMLGWTKKRERAPGQPAFLCARDMGYIIWAT